MRDYKRGFNDGLERAACALDMGYEQFLDPTWNADKAVKLAGARLMEGLANEIRAMMKVDA